MPTPSNPHRPPDDIHSSWTKLLPLIIPAAVESRLNSLFGGFTAAINVTSSAITNYGAAASSPRRCKGLCAAIVFSRLRWFNEPIDLLAIPRPFDIAAQSLPRVPLAGELSHSRRD